MWDIEYGLIEPWLDKQDESTVASIFSALELLQEQEPSLGRPLVDTLSTKEIRNLKELRPPSPGSSEVRIIFAFDPARRAIMLLRGDKSRGRTGKTKWSYWYKRAIPEAERRYKEHLASMARLE